MFFFSYSPTLLAEYAYVLAVGVSDLLLIKTEMNFLRATSLLAIFQIFCSLCVKWISLLRLSSIWLPQKFIFLITLCRKQKCVESANVS